MKVYFTNSLHVKQMQAAGSIHETRKSANRELRDRQSSESPFPWIVVLVEYHDSFANRHFAGYYVTTNDDSHIV